MYKLHTTLKSMYFVFSCTQLTLNNRYNIQDAIYKGLSENNRLRLVVNFSRIVWKCIKCSIVWNKFTYSIIIITINEIAFAARILFLFSHKIGKLRKWWRVFEIWRKLIKTLTIVYFFNCFEQHTWNQQERFMHFILINTKYRP